MPYNKDHAENYEELYKLAKEAYVEEQQRGIRVDEKASRLMTTLTAVIGVYAFLAKLLADKIIPPSGLLEWAMVALSGALFMTLTASWVFFFSVLRLGKILRMPFDESVFEIFDTKNLQPIYRAYAKRSCEVVQKNERTINRKVFRTTYGYRALSLSIFFLLALISCYGIYIWTDQTNRAQVSGREVKAMSEKHSQEQNPKPESSPPTTPEPPSESEPSPSESPDHVVYPRPKSVTESYGDTAADESDLGKSSDD